MSVVTGTIELAAENADTAVGHAIEVMRETATEKGCIVYRFYRDLENPALFRVYEEWESETDLHAYLKSPHVAEFGRKLQEIKVLSWAIKVLEISGERDL